MVNVNTTNKKISTTCQAQTFENVLKAQSENQSDSNRKQPLRYTQRPSVTNPENVGDGSSRFTKSAATSVGEVINKSK